MEAMVRADARWSNITACGGREFIKSEWRGVPPGMEAEAQRNEYLAVREPDAAEPALILSEDGIVANFAGPITGAATETPATDAAGGIDAGAGLVELSAAVIEGPALVVEAEKVAAGRAARKSGKAKGGTK